MAKNDMFGQNRLTPAEQKKKAIGNPNKNIHSKKKNSNYSGYQATQAPKKTPEKKQQVPRWIARTVLVLALILSALIVLQLTVLKDNMLFSHITSMYVAGVLMFMFYTRFDTYRREDTTFAKVFSVILVGGAILYAASGISGIINMLK